MMTIEEIRQRAREHEETSDKLAQQADKLMTRALRVQEMASIYAKASNRLRHKAIRMANAQSHPSH